MKPEATVAVVPAGSQHEARLLLMGQDSRGNWVVQDQRGLRGGLFVSRAAALRFALSENGGRLELVVTVASALELDLNGDGATAAPRQRPEPRPATCGARPR